MHIKSLALAALASTSAVAQSMNLTAALSSNSQLSSFYSLLGQFPNLTAQLGGLSNITLLAPNNAAIAALLNSTAGAAITTNTALVNALLTYHVINGTYATFGNASSFVKTALMPGNYANVTGGQRVEIIPQGNSTTIFSGLRAISTTSGSAMNFTGGYIHVINEVLTVPTSISTSAIAFNLTAAAGALTTANLVNTVDSAQNITIFVPNNAAFQRIGSAVANLTTQQLTQILEYHVVPGTVAYSSMLRNESIPTLNGANVTISVHNGSAVFVNSARVVIPDVLVANGVMHIIDNVLNPSNAMTSNSTAATTGAPAYSGASTVTYVPYTSGVATPTVTVNTATNIVATVTAAAGTATSSAGAWMPKPTGLGAALMAGGALIMAL